MCICVHCICVHCYIQQIAKKYLLDGYSLSVEDDFPFEKESIALLRKFGCIVAPDSTLKVEDIDYVIGEVKSISSSGADGGENGGSLDDKKDDMVGVGEGGEVEEGSDHYATSADGNSDAGDAGEESDADDENYEPSPTNNAVTIGDDDDDDDDDDNDNGSDNGSSVVTYSTIDD